MSNIANKITYNIDKNGCWICTSHKASHDSRPEITINGKRQKIYRYIYEINNNIIIPKGMVIMHKCDNSLCINPKHLELCTHNDNIQDCVNKKRNAFGEKNGHAKLKESQVINILKDNIHTRKELSNMYNCKYSNIVDIKLGRRWTYLFKK